SRSRWSLNNSRARAALTSRPKRRNRRPASTAAAPTTTTIGGINHGHMIDALVPLDGESSSFYTVRREQPSDAAQRSIRQNLDRYRLIIGQKLPHARRCGAGQEYAAERGADAKV